MKRAGTSLGFTDPETVKCIRAKGSDFDQCMHLLRRRGLTSHFLAEHVGSVRHCIGQRVLETSWLMTVIRKKIVCLDFLFLFIVVQSFKTSRFLDGIYRKQTKLLV